MVAVVVVVVVLVVVAGFEITTLDGERVDGVGGLRGANGRLAGKFKGN